MKTVNYKGYQAQVEYDDGALFVKILHISDLLVAECEKASEVEDVAKDLIDTYLEDCRELGKPPEKPFKGSFNIRVTPEMHKRAAMAAVNGSISLNSWVSQAIEEKLECAKLSERLDGVVSDTREQVIKQIVSTGEQSRLQNSRTVLRHWENETIVVHLEEYKQGKKQA